MKDGYLFQSSLFDIEAGEDDETNPQRYGRQLALWIKMQFEEQGYEVEDVIAEDWGWCVMCQREPFSLWIGCGNQDDYRTATEDSSLPKGSDVIWSCFPVVEVSFFKKLLGKAPASATSSALEKLDQELKHILINEPSIKLIDEN